MDKPLTQNFRIEEEPPSIQEYEKSGGYMALRKALEIPPQDVQRLVKESNLRGRGGAGFQTGMKWSFVPMGPDAPRPKYYVVNADEMEPGTFKDRYLLENDPHQIIEGAIIGAYAIEAEFSYIFLRWEYRRAARRIEKAIAEAYQRGYLGKNILKSGMNLEMHLHVSAGRYMCGEEFGLLDALEGRRAHPRAKPPFPQVCGLWGRPTVVNNVETVANIRHIIMNGPEWYRGLSLSGDGGTKLFGVSGKVRRPGLWELPMGISLEELLVEHAGGMQEGYRLKGLLPGGASTDFLTHEHLQVKLDFDSVQQIGSRLGTGTVVVLDDKTCPVGMVHNLMEFFARESCGWCTPCREGLPWIEKTMAAIENGNGKPGDIEMLEEQTRLMAPGNTFCALAPGAMEPLQSAIKHFRDDFERHISERRCPWRK
ncbi:MAG: NADH oxidoreductase (quinone) subunit F [Candidatus Abyssobacteria bacterium SURF_5]|uniref:NADH-quinone oxidoreductase subunit F n=1 Tax=Abyssobacteria bacterium (strain SURF_5) TaxID=2093360 RepID=A0A3A4N6H5_ABYX5|nr:MAG: NADH oxidoreductase (quinone) subunit F [Candidatus Abyssubacteria bacterium SURF_5]